MTNEPVRGRPDLINQAFMEGVEEIIGLAGVHAVANQIDSLCLNLSSNRAGSVIKAGPALTQRALEELYGSRGGRGISLRAGRSSFKYILRRYGAGLGLTEINYRLLPAPVRLRTGLVTLGNLLSENDIQMVQFSETNTAWIWRVEPCLMCQDRSSTEAVCAFLTGLLQEFLAWASGGKVYAVREVECHAMGRPACLFQIDQKPLE
jgi:predicted hydrocarbon binding protein